MESIVFFEGAKANGGAFVFKSLHITSQILLTVDSFCEYIRSTEKKTRHRMTHKMSGSMKIAVLAAVIALSRGYTSPWGYTCEEGTTCKKQEKGGQENLLTLRACTLTCPSQNLLWPLPSTFTTGNTVTSFHPDLFKLDIKVNKIY